MENIISKTAPHKNVWIPQKYRVLDVDTHGLTKNVFKVWDLIHKQNKWIYNSPLMSLTETNFFIPGKETRLGNKMGAAQIKDITEQGKIKTLLEIKEKNGRDINFWEYLQLKHLINSIPTPLRDEKKLTPLEKLCSTQTPVKHVILRVYQILTESELQGKPYFIVKWETEICKKFEDQQVERIIASVHNTATDMNTIEMNYKNS